MSDHDPSPLPFFGLEVGLIPALETADLDRARRLLDALQGVEGIVAFRIGAALALRHGLAELARRVRDHTDLKLIYDHQRAGIGLASDAERLAVLAQEAKLDALVWFPLGGPAALDAAVAVSETYRLLPIVGGELPAADYGERDGGYVSDDAPLRIAGRALELGVEHLLVPGHDPARIERYAALATSQAERPALLIGGYSGAIAEIVRAARPCLVYALVGHALSEAADPGEFARRLAGQALDAA
jgi:orotidine-5'-phosphate decarboxylase